MGQGIEVQRRQNQKREETEVSTALAAKKSFDI